MSSKVSVNVEVLTPRTPNFLKISDGKKMPIENFSDDTLKTIGEQWVKNLLAAKAAKLAKKTEKKDDKAKGATPPATAPDKCAEPKK